jgi:hypothetical protein
LRRSVINTNGKSLEVSREVIAGNLQGSVDEFLVDAWKRTRKGARNLHFNVGFGAETQNPISITGLKGTEPFSGTLGGNSMKTDSADLGMEYYFKDNWAVELGVIFSNAVRDEESVDYGVLSYDDVKHLGTFAGVKYCFDSMNESGGAVLNGRARLFVNARLGLMEEFDVSGKVLFEDVNSSVDLSTSGDAYLTLGLGAGVLYAWTDHIAFELGVNVVNSITDMEGSWELDGPDLSGDTYSGDYTTDLSMTRAYFGVLFGF